MEDFFYKFKQSFNNLPLPIRNAIGHAYENLPNSIRYGKFYSEYRKRIADFTNPQNAREVGTHQFELLKRTVNHAIAQIPYYKDFQNIQDINDFRNLPVMRKSDYLESLDRFSDASLSGQRINANTGGSSGTPMSFYLHKNVTRPKEKAHFDWFWGLFGYRPGDKVVQVRGTPLQDNKLYEERIIGNMLSISCYELNESNVAQAIDVIKKFKPKFIHAYPSALHILTDYIQDPGNLGDVLPVKAVFLGSEGLNEDDFRRYGEFYKATVVNWYGHTECAIFGGNYPGSQQYYYFPFYGYVELLGEDGSVITEPAKIGRIVATSFDNLVMPFIRYDTEDLGELSVDKAMPDGTPCTVIRKIHGRLQDRIILSDGTKVSATAFIFGQHLPQFEGIREMQLEQNEIGKLLIRVVENRNWQNTDAQSMKKLLEKSVSQKLDVNVALVDLIPKTHRGKHRFVVQNCE